tara:strand:- start:936 stop:1352 length:417 start_codon:yes stop_codon:yes gene_type:complete
MTTKLKTENREWLLEYITGYSIDQGYDGVANADDRYVDQVNEMIEEGHPGLTSYTDEELMYLAMGVDEARIYEGYGNAQPHVGEMSGLNSKELSKIPLLRERRGMHLMHYQDVCGHPDFVKATDDERWEYVFDSLSYN